VLVNTWQGDCSVGFVEGICLFRFDEPVMHYNKIMTNTSIFHTANNLNNISLSFLLP
jgi:hypothetical protein